MKIAVASGKGGTGKTTIATSLAISLVDWGNVTYVDCDVEAPNGHLFLHPELQNQSQAFIFMPQIQVDKCKLCEKCVQVCQFHALAGVGKNIMVFPQLCHGCGSCTWNCPEQAIVEVPNPIGVLETGITEIGIQFMRGVLTLSEPMPTPIIRQLKKLIHPNQDEIVILDSPPGASCSVVETLRGTDFALLITEPTPFGLHDLQQMMGIVKEMDIPAGIIVNRDGIGDYHFEEFINQANIPVLFRIPFEERIASGIAAGQSLVNISPEYKPIFQHIYVDILNLINGVEL